VAGKWLNRRRLRRLPSVPLAGAYLPGAHHPHCHRYDHHLIWIAGRPLCLGCTSLAIGAVLAASTLTFVPWAQVTVETWIVGHLLLLMPTGLQPWCQRKSFKIIARTLLGMTSVSYWISGTFFLRSPWPRWMWVASMACAFGLSHQLLTRIRTSQTPDPCQSCPEGLPDVQLEFATVAGAT